MKGEHRQLTYLAVFIMLALLIHAAVVLPLIEMIMWIQPKSSNYEPMNIELWNNNSLSNYKKKSVQTPEEELENYKPKEEPPDGKVIQVNNPNKIIPSKNTKFLSQYNSSTKKETQSVLHNRPNNKQILANLQQQIPQKIKNQKVTTNKQELPKEIKKKNDLATAASKLDQSNPNIHKAMQINQPSTSQSKNNINFQPNQVTMSQAIAGTGLDYLDDIVEADNTSVNSKGWKYASFFNRVKHKVGQFWHPDIVYKKHDPYGNIYGNKDRTSVILVILYPDGRLKKLYVMNPSGVPFLDDEAYNAIKQAAPFPNVPKGLQSKNDGLVKFTFHFILKIGSRPVLRMRRYH